MSTTDLTKKIGGRERRLIIQNVESQETPTKDGELAPKVTLTCRSKEGQEFTIDEALLLDPKDGNIKSKGLWISEDTEGRIRANSTIAKMLHHYKIETIAEMQSLEIIALPKRNNYLAIVIDPNITDDALPW